jgi:hypothetical protein
MGELNTYNELLETTATVAETLCRSTLLEGLLKHARSQAAEELGRALVKLYASILTYLAKARTYYLQNGFSTLPQTRHGPLLTKSGRVLKNGILASSDLESAFSAINKAQGDIHSCFGIFSLQGNHNSRQKVPTLTQ